MRLTRVAKQDSWRQKEAERKRKGKEVMTFLRPTDKGLSWNGIWGDV